MNSFPETRESLLALLGDSDNCDAWEQFATIYRPLVYRLARQRGLQDADAQDLSQQVLVSVASAIGRWEKNDDSVRFRHWLRRVARNAIINSLSRKPRDGAVGGTTVGRFLNEQPRNDSVTDAQIETGYRRELYLQAADVVRVDVEPDTWRAFELTVVNGMAIADAANELGKSTGTIYAARSRIMRRLREAVNKIEGLQQ